jgi:hypothetical protein
MLKKLHIIYKYYNFDVNYLISVIKGITLVLKKVRAVSGDTLKASSPIVTEMPI